MVATSWWRGLWPWWCCWLHLTASNQKKKPAMPEVNKCFSGTVPYLPLFPEMGNPPGLSPIFSPVSWPGHRPKSHVVKVGSASTSCKCQTTAEAYPKWHHLESKGPLDGAQQVLHLFFLGLYKGKKKFSINVPWLCGLVSKLTISLAVDKGSKGTRACVVCITAKISMKGQLRLVLWPKEEHA